MKPPNVPLKDFLIQETAEQMELPLELVKDIISFQGEDASKAAHTYNEIEFSGFGKFLISQYRTKKKIEKMQNKLERGEVREEQKERYLLHIEDLKNRLRQ